MRRLFAFSALLLAGLGCTERDGREAEAPSPTPVVSVGEISAATLRPGESTSLDVPVVVADGYHVQANPAAGEFLVPLELRMDPAEGLRLGSPAYPRGRGFRLKGADDELLTYEGGILIGLPVAASIDATPGARAVQGSLRYQACDARRCLAPVSVPVGFAIVVSAETMR